MVGSMAGRSARRDRASSRHRHHHRCLCHCHHHHHRCLSLVPLHPPPTHPLLLCMPRMRSHAPTVPGPGTHEMSLGMGRTRPIPASGFPRARPFYSPHLRALGKFAPSANERVGGGVTSPGGRDDGGGVLGGGLDEAQIDVGSPTAHVISYAPLATDPGHE